MCGRFKAAVLSGLLLLALSGQAVHAELVQEFAVGIKDITTYGAYTLVLSSRTYDTTGVAAPLLSRVELRFPYGFRVRRGFLKGRRLCDVERLKNSPGRNPKICRRAALGTGHALIDPRPLFGEVIPAKLYAFLARPADSASVASIAILAVPNRHAPLVKRYPVLRDVRPLLAGRLAPGPHADRRFGYRLDLPLIDEFSIAEFSLAFRGLTKRVSVCTGSAGHSCSRRSRRIKRVFWATPPKCSPSGDISLSATYTFLSNLTYTRTAHLSCSAIFSRYRR